MTNDIFQADGITKQIRSCQLFCQVMTTRHGVPIPFETCIELVPKRRMLGAAPLSLQGVMPECWTAWGRCFIFVSSVFPLLKQLGDVFFFSCFGFVRESKIGMIKHGSRKIHGTDRPGPHEVEDMDGRFVLLVFKKWSWTIPRHKTFTPRTGVFHIMLVGERCYNVYLYPPVN